MTITAAKQNLIARARYAARSAADKRRLGRYNPRGPYGPRPSRVLHAPVGLPTGLELNTVRRFGPKRTQSDDHQ